MDFHLGLVCACLLTLANGRNAPPSQRFLNCGFNLTATCDDHMELFVDGNLLATSNSWKITSDIHVPENSREIEIRCTDTWIHGGILASSDNGLITDGEWICSSDDGNSWTPAYEIGENGVTSPGISEKAKWIWTDRHTWKHTLQQRHTYAICKIKLGTSKCPEPTTPTPTTTTQPHTTPGVYTLTATCDDKMKLFVDGNLLATSRNWRYTSQVVIPENTQIIEIHCTDTGTVGGILASSDNGLLTDGTWNCSSDNGHTWIPAYQVGPNGRSVPDISPEARWIWAGGCIGDWIWKYTGKTHQNNIICKIDLDSRSPTTSSLPISSVPATFQGDPLFTILRPIVCDTGSCFQVKMNPTIIESVCFNTSTSSTFEFSEKLFTYSGKVPPRSSLFKSEDGIQAIFTCGNGTGLYGSIHMQDILENFITLNIEQYNNNDQIVTYLPASDIPEDEGIPDIVDEQSEFSQPDPQLLQQGDSDNTTLARYSIKFYYTPQFAADTSDIWAFIDQALAVTNQGYANSKVPLEAYSRCAELATIDDQDSALNILLEFRRMKGSVRKLRGGADIAALLVKDFDACGIAYVNTVVTAGSTVSVTKKSCILGYYSLGHEIGHNIGLLHDRANSINTIYPYGHGHLIQAGASSKGKRTILAYDAEGYKDRVNYYSNPAVIHPETKTPTGVKGVSNNAALLLRNRFILQNLGDGHECDGTSMTVAVDGGWSNWSNYGVCSATCGVSTKRRLRTCTNPAPSHGGSTCSGSNEETTNCNFAPCAVDGGWSNWSKYGDCSATCGVSIKRRLRTCTNPAPSYGGIACSGSNKETTTCNFAACEVDGGWSNWNDYGVCSATCGVSTKRRLRTCSKPAPSHGGSPCSGSKEETTNCNVGSCAVDGGWSNWSNYGVCSATCGVSTKRRWRTCTNPAPSHGGSACSGSNEETTNCNFVNCAVDGGWSNWSNYNACSTTCGISTKRRLRTCTNPAPLYGGSACSGLNEEISSCSFYPCAVDGGWSYWSNYGVCSATCGVSTKRRLRTCTKPAPSHGGSACSGLNEDTTNCNLPTCAVDGGWSNWSNYGVCSATCGVSTKRRMRTCNNPLPTHGGSSCSGSNEETTNCNFVACAVDGGWSNWSNYGVCSATCGVSTKRRMRTCTNPSPTHGGSACSGSYEETNSCNFAPCAVDGGWSNWSNYGVCSATCGVSTKRRLRTCTNPAPSHGGRACSGSNEDTANCNFAACGANCFIINAESLPITTHNTDPSSPSAQNCQVKCQEDSSCQWFNYIPAGLKYAGCWLIQKAKTGELRSNKQSGWVTGPKYCGFPSKVLGLYLLLADDTINGRGTDDEQDVKLYEYQQTGTNVLFFTFIHPVNMVVPKSFITLADSRGSDRDGAVPAGTKIIFVIGGQGYSKQVIPWPWLTTKEKAEAMAKKVAQWKDDYNCDGIDLAIHLGAGNEAVAGENLIHFVKTIKELQPDMIISQPVFGYPGQVEGNDQMVNAAWSSAGLSNGLLDGVGIMVYEDSGSLQWVSRYTDGNPPITARVPKSNMLVGVQGSASSGNIVALAEACIDRNLQGIMVWVSSVRNGIHYGENSSGNTDSEKGLKMAMKLFQQNME